MLPSWQKGTTDLIKSKTKTKSKTKSIYYKSPSRENFLAFKKAKNKCNAINKEASRRYIKEATKDGDNKLSTYFITMKKDGELISSEKTLVKLFNENYINIVETSSGNRPSLSGYPSDQKRDKITVKANIPQYSTHPSVEIKEHFTLQEE